jgi:aspartyl aminopeptidase
LEVVGSSTNEGPAGNAYEDFLRRMNVEGGGKTSGYVADRKEVLAEF